MDCPDEARWWREVGGLEPWTRYRHSRRWSFVLLGRFVALSGVVVVSTLLPGPGYGERHGGFQDPRRPRRVVAVVSLFGQRTSDRINRIFELLAGESSPEGRPTRRRRQA